MDINTNLEFKINQQPSSTLPQLGLVALYDVCIEKHLDANQNSAFPPQAEPVFVKLTNNTPMK